MNEDISFPRYIPRAEERQIRDIAAQVREDRKSRAILLYGPGGVGKTSLVRELARTSAADERTIWLDPIDIDDSEYWLLSNLERHVAERLDPGNQYFGPYMQYLSRLPRLTRAPIEQETVVSHLGRIKRVFGDCYKSFVEGAKEADGSKDAGSTEKTVVIVLDTVEAIRGMYLLLTLTQWMKALPATLFILSGRPLPGHADSQDPIKNELEDPYQPLPVTPVQLGEFTEKAALDYLDHSIAARLDPDEKSKLVLLTRGHPLWLAFTISYLGENGMPEEAEAPLEEIRRALRYRGEMSQEGKSLHEAFKRRLVAPYRESDFWHEAIKRLAVVRESVNQPIWQHLMSDRPLPDGVASLEQAWTLLLQTPWIRPRANRRYVTLHDAVAEELAQRIIPLHDQDKQWRKQLWRRALAVYGELTQAREEELAAKQAAVDERLQLLDERQQGQGESEPPTAEATAFIQEVARLDAQKRELHQLKAVRLYYQIISDFEAGCRQFLKLLRQAEADHDVLFQDLLAFEMQRFLPGEVPPYGVDDVVGAVIEEFRSWLTSDSRQGLYLELGLGMADYLVGNGQPQTAIELLDKLPEPPAADHGLRYLLSVLRGNAYMRIPRRMREGLPYFLEALSEAQEIDSPNRTKLVAEAHKELGFYYRNEGSWQKADDAYQQARDAISQTLSVRSSDEDREEAASIQTNWAYVKGLGGSYRDGSNLVESAITVRRRLKKHLAEGNSWSVCGEVYRYERRFEKAWAAYAEAERIFHGQRNWAWLGMIYQEQAICLFQATEDGVNLTPDRDPVEQAKRLITLALDICSDQAVRGYPSALNRAARIYGREDRDAGFRYLNDGIEWARRLSDGWFWFANLIEYVELSYRAWVVTEREEYLARIAGREAEIMQAMREYEFPDLRGRWDLLQGHLGVHAWLDTGDRTLLSTALQNYKDGFGLIAQGYVGSSGASAIPGEFKTFGGLFSRLSPDIRDEWQEELRRAWSNLEHGGSTLLLARLEELY